MEQVAAAGDGAGERGGVFHRPDRDFDREAGEVTAVAGGPRQNPHRMALAQQHARYRGPDKPGCAGYEAQPDGKGHAAPPIRHSSHLQQAVPLSV